MIDLTQLWIGDPLRLDRTGEIVRYQGSRNGKVVIKAVAGEMLVPASELSIADEPEEKEAFALEEESNAAPFYDHTNFPKSIDLHIETLNPAYVNHLPERILSYQLEALASYVEQAESLGIHFVTIIHGKGTGVLKSETAHYLKGRDKVKFTVMAHQGGATEVWFK